MLFNRSYTTGHKSFRARATVELGEMLGWQNAHDVVYAGALDLAVGPRWYSTYEMAQNVCLEAFEGRDRDFLCNGATLTADEQATTLDLLLNDREPSWTNQITALLKAGRGPRQILDLIQVASAEVILWTGDPRGFSMPQHSYEYCNTLRWFYDRFEHEHQVKLLYVAAAFVNRAADHQRNTPDNGPNEPRPPAGAARFSAAALLPGLEPAVLAVQADEGVAQTQAYLAQGFDRLPDPNTRRGSGQDRQ